MRRRVLFLPMLALAGIAALLCARGAWSVGPSLPALESGTLAALRGDTRYAVRTSGSTTTVRKLVGGRPVAALRIRGGWGIQLATLHGDLAGLSGDGRTLVLGDDVEPDGQLRSRSRFAVIDTTTLSLRRVVTLRGDYSVDALSPNGATLYLIHHVGGRDVSSYRVNGYDLATGRLLPGVIADKRQAGWTMAGYPVARVATPDGRWVYTLYQQGDNYPFVHALDAEHRTAVCVGLPVDWHEQWISNARLVLADGRLEIRTRGGTTRLLLDTRTFVVSRP